MVSKDSDLNMDSPLQLARAAYQPRLPSILQDLGRVKVEQEALELSARDPSMEALFPNTWGQPLLRLAAGSATAKPLPRRVGVVFSGGQAPGGHNVITGLYDALKRRNGASRLFGFLEGTSGLLAEMRYLEISDIILSRYRNQGGFDLLGSGRTKIETPEQLEAVKKMVWALELHALVIIGGDDSNTNAAVLAEYFRAEKVPCQVLGVPKTIDGDLQNRYIETSFGFDTACKIYSETIGNIARDALSAKKYYYFIKMMGRSASHITLECALQTHPNLALIAEEVAAQGLSLQEVTSEIVDLICLRADRGKHFGIILIPEGIIEFIPEFRSLIGELNKVPDPSQLSSESSKCFSNLPKNIQDQLMMDRDPHGNVQVSKIETERLFIQLVEQELKNRKKADKFSAQPHFCGYEGRSGFPSNFDSDYCYSLGCTAALVIESGATGYVVFIQGLKEGVESWRPGAFPLASMIHLEERKGVKRPVIAKALVDLKGPLFAQFAERRGPWKLDDAYRYPGPMQFFGPPEVADCLTFTLQLQDPKDKDDKD